MTNRKLSTSYVGQYNDCPAGTAFSSIASPSNRLSQVSECDDCVEKVTLPFDLTWITGEVFDTVGVSSNGAISVPYNSDSLCCRPWPIAPGGYYDAAIPRISVAQEDLFPSYGGGDIYMLEAADGDSVTFSWENMAFFGCSSCRINAQVTLHKSGSITFCWGSGDTGFNSIAAGIEDDEFSLAFPVPLPGFDQYGITGTYPAGQCACFVNDPETYVNTVCPLDKEPAWKNFGKYNNCIQEAAAELPLDTEVEEALIKKLSSIFRGKVGLCHYGGETDTCAHNFVHKYVGDSAVDKHLNLHGDFLGSCAPSCADICMAKSLEELDGCRAYTPFANTAGDCCCGSTDTIYYKCGINAVCDTEENTCVCTFGSDGGDPNSPTEGCPTLFTYACSGGIIELTSLPQDLPGSGEQLDFSFPGLPDATGDVTVKVFAHGDMGSSWEYFAITAEGSVFLGNVGDDTQDTWDCLAEYKTGDFIISQADFNSYNADGEFMIEADATIYVDTFCVQDDVFIKLIYTVDECPY